MKKKERKEPDCLSDCYYILPDLPLRDRSGGKRGEKTARESISPSFRGFVFLLTKHDKFALEQLTFSLAVVLLCGNGELWLALTKKN